MIRQSVIDLFIPITEEEKKILADDGQINASLYADRPDFLNDIQTIFQDDCPIHIRKHTRFCHFPPHKHNYIEIVYMCCGTTAQILNGNQIVLKQGQLLILSPNTQQEILPARETDIAINLLVRKEFFHSEIFLNQTQNNMISSFLASILFYSNESGYMIFDTDGVCAVENLLENVIIDILDNQPTRNTIRQSTFALLFLELTNRRTDTIYSGGRDVARMVDVFRYIETCFATATLSDMADKLHCSTSFLSHYIKSKTGFSFSTLLHRQRLQVAAQMLRCTDKNIDDIIRDCGYESTGYFYRAFRAKYGVSPRTFRKST